MSKVRTIILRLHILLVTLLVPVFVRLVPLKKLLALATPGGRLSLYEKVDPEEISRMVRRRLRRPRSMRSRRCLREGLTLFYFLRLSGADAVIHIALHKPTPGRERLRAHCWVVLDGRAMSKPIRGPAVTLMTHG